MGSSSLENSLHEATRNGNVEKVKELVKEHKGNAVYFTTPNKAGQTPLHFASMFGEKEILEILLTVPEIKEAIGQKNYCDETPLHSACYKGKVESVKVLTEAGAPIEEEGLDKGTTPLYYAMEFGQIECAAVLINAGANASMISEDTKRSLLLAACKAGMAGTVDSLLPSIDDLDSLRDEKGRSCVHIVLDEGHADCLAMFSKHNRGLDAKSQDGSTILHMVCQKKQHQLVKALLDWHANPNERRKNGNTALHDACASGNLKCIKALIEGGANLDVQNDIGDTPVHIAVACQDDKAVRMLKDSEANLKLRNKTGMMPWTVAKLKRNDVIMKMLTEQSNVKDKKDKHKLPQLSA